jgi:regulatory protein YycH of two-component signal transduction system YycFG
LKPGINYHQVHDIVKGYDKVFNCFGTDEIYYYFSPNDENAFRYLISYDEKGNYSEMQSDDNNSRTLSVWAECKTGRLGEK